MDETPIIRGLELRAVLVLALLAFDRPLSVAELVNAVGRAGFAPPGRPGKAVADALRWEVRRGRVRRLGRDSYRAGYVAKSTRHRMRARVAQTRNRVDLTWRTPPTDFRDGDLPSSGRCA